MNATCHITSTVLTPLWIKCLTNLKNGKLSFPYPVLFSDDEVLIFTYYYYLMMVFRYCPKCKTDSSKIVKAGEKLKESKKKAKAPSTLNKETNRDWGRGMACAGRSKECTIVPSNHFGPIPGVDVGTTWRFRFQVSVIITNHGIIIIIFVFFFFSN